MKPEIDVEILRLQESDAARWDEYVHSCPAATFSHLTGWKRLVERTWGHTPCYMYARRDGKIVGVLPLFYVGSRLTGPSLLSLPNAVYGGAAADSPGIGSALIEAAKRLATELRVRHLELRDDTESTSVEDPQLHPKDLYAAFAHSICTDDEALAKTLPRDVRRMIRVGAKNGLTVSFGREEMLDVLYDAFAASVHRLGTPVFPKRLFVECLRQYPDADIMVVRKDSEVAAAVLNFYFRGTVFPYYSGTYHEFNRTGVNNFMYWELMRAAARRGCTTFDFGRSKRGTGAYEFKRGWGMRERTLPYKYFLVTAKAVPDVNPLNPTFARLTRAWRRLPPTVARAIGPVIVRHLP